MSSRVSVADPGVIPGKQMESYMQCSDVRAALEPAGKAGSQNPSAARSARVAAHLVDCADCRTLAADLQFRGLLKVLPMTDPGAGYADRALAQAWATHSSHSKKTVVARTGLGLAAAAMLVVAVGVGLRVSPPTGSPAELTSAASAPASIVAAAPREVREIDLLMVSAAALPAATISLQLDEHVVLAGYPGRNSLSWPAALVAGNNQLTLPVQLSGAQSGTIIVAVEAGGARKQMMVTVQATNQQALARLAI